MRAVIVTGGAAGSARGPTSVAAATRSTGATGRRRTRFRATAAASVALRIFDLTKPVIAAINGPAVGVGITMTLPMDIRLAAEGAKIGFVFARRGIVPEACSSWFLPRIVGISQAMEWVATGRVFSAEEALAGRLVRSVHPQAELLEAARALAARDQRERAGLGGARAPHAVDDAGGGAPDGGAPGRLAGDVRARTVRRRARGRHVVPREARLPCSAIG